VGGALEWTDQLSCDDGLLPDAGSDAMTLTCAPVSESTLEGVTIAFPEQPCTFTLAEAAAGIELRYSVVITGALADVITDPQDAGGCQMPGPSGLIVHEVISGGGQRYCLCDTGLCPRTPYTVDLVAGSTPATITWTGRNWDGPSDTGMPLGEPFPPGDYAVEVTAIGTFMSASYQVRGRYPIRLVP
jgi:hypothetical protein